MAILFFMPWVTTKSKFDFRNIQFLPYLRGKLPGDIGSLTQTTIDQILGNYANHANFPTNNMAVPINTATLLIWKDDFSNDEIDSKIRFGQYLAISAISKRQYGSHFNYCNADGVALYGQRYESEEAAAAVSFSKRRRDGQENIYLSASRGRPYFLRPNHVDEVLNVEYDFPLLEALEKIVDADLISQISDAITLFNRANSDASEITESSEIVLIRAAFETLLNASFKTEDLCKKISDHFKNVLNPAVWYAGCYDENIWKMRWPATKTRNIQRPLDAWINDFCDVRNSSAHGKNTNSKYDSSIWSIQNHLMFASWFFPLVLKGVLSEKGYYTMSTEDKDYRIDFEKFFSVDISSKTPENNLEWNTVMDELNLKELERIICSGFDD
jgi:hypothetical protein